MAQEIKKDDFEKEVVEKSKEKPVLVDFFAPWCAPCKMQGPVVDEVAENLGDKGEAFKINIDENQEIAEKYGVMSIPTLILFKDGEVKETMVGMQAKENLLQLFE